MAASKQKKDNRGGARPGSGRKPITLSERSVKNLIKRLEEAAKAHGKDIDELIVEKLYSRKTTDRNFLTAWKLVKEYTAPKLTEGGEADKNLGPAFFLPERKDNVVPMK